MSKYKNVKCELDGKTFDSLKEMRRYKKLKEMQEQGIITELQTQVKYSLIPKQVLNKPRVNSKGRIQNVEMPVDYVADFTYRQADGELIVEDTKSPTTKTPQYIIKRKLMKQIYNIEISEV